MPRTRSYDRDDVLEKAAFCFWEWGYEGATISRLEEATGLDRRQLFREFGDKQRLFVAALELIAAMAGTFYLDRLEDPESSLPEIRRTILSLAEQPGHPVGRFGCVFCNATREASAMNDPEIAEFVLDHIDRIERGYRGALERAFKRGEVALEGSSVRAGARSLLATHMGIQVLVRAGRSSAYVQDVGRHALRGLS